MFANIHLENKNLGVISNVDGGFKIPSKYQELGSILVVSSMGYQTKKILIFDLSTIVTNVIRLEPALIELSEAIIRAKVKPKRLSAEQIVQKAIDAILENYSITPYSKVGYYRDYQFINGTYVNLNEAILEVFDQGFKAIDSSTSRVLLYDYQANIDFERDTLARQPYDYDMKGGAKIINSGYLDSYGGNEFTILRVHDAIRNHTIDSYSFVHRFDEDLVEEHSFYKEKDSKIDDEPLYAIRFSKKLLKHSAFGKLYISKYDFSIYQMEYAVYNDSKPNTTAVPDKNGSKSKLIFEVKTSYRPQNGKMYLSYISFHNNFTLWNPPKFRLKYIEFKFDAKPVDQKRNGIYDNIHSKKSWVELTFSENVDEATASKLKNYSAKFMGEQLKFDSLKVRGKKVTLYPKSRTVLQQQMLNEIEILTKKNELNEKNTQFKIKNVKDVGGNYINEWTSKNYDQFREFFVQQIKSDSFSPVSGKFMKKDEPIFTDQPVTKPDNFSDYWMNTPLKTIDN